VFAVPLWLFGQLSGCLTAKQPWQGDIGDSSGSSDQAQGVADALRFEAEAGECSARISS
jgi:hypothetical protein